MVVKKILLTLATTVSIWSLLIAFGPVKFSASSSGNVDEQNIPPGDDGDDGTPNPTPTTSPTVSPTGTPSLRDVTYTNTIAPKDYKLDIVLVIDDSNSMLPDNQKLAKRLSNLVAKLDNKDNPIDWQMCATVTRDILLADKSRAWGASIYWQNSDTPTTSLGMVLKKGTSNLSTIFEKTINYIDAGWLNSDDERGIKAAYQHAKNGDLRYNPNNGCYRADSAITYIIISDEDERSIGGDASQQVYANELKTLENEDKPQFFVNHIKSTFGTDRRFTVNSIIVIPGQTACKAAQDAQGAKSHYGFKYQELSKLTGGGVGSICENDYAKNLDLFFAKIKDSLSSVPLECAPYNGNIAVTITPSAGTVQSRIEGMNLVFDTPIQEGRTITLKYQCNDARSPSSIAPDGKTELGFFAKILNFFKNLF